MAFYRQSPLGAGQQGKGYTPPTEETPENPTYPVNKTPAECDRRYNECTARCQQMRGGSPTAYQNCLNGCQRAKEGCLTTAEPGAAYRGGDETTPVGGCPPEADQAKPYSGSGNCPCGSRFSVPSSTYACPAGYRMVMGSKGPACRCEDWCAEGLAAGTLTAACTGTGAGAEEGLGEYQWPTEITDFYNMLMGRGKDIMNMPYGYTPEAMNTMFGQNFEKVRALENPARETLLNTLSREGLLGTGAGTRAQNELSWNVEKGVSDLVRTLFTQNEEQKREDMQKYTTLAQSLFGTGMDYNTILEQINSARRGEAQGALALWMQYILGLANSWSS